MPSARPLVCIECRLRVAAGEACDCKKDRRVDVTTREGRAALIDEVWGTPSARRNARDAARAGATGAGFGGASNLLDCLDCGSTSSSSSSGCESVGGSSSSGIGDLGELGSVILVVLAAAIVFVVLYFVIRWIVRKVNEYRNRPRPHGALTRPRPVLGAGVQGRVRRIPDLVPFERSPSGISCLAWTSELRHRRVLGEGAMLRDSSTSGFVLELDDHREVYIPPGRLRIESRPERVSRGTLGTTGYLGELDPLRAVEAHGESVPDEEDPFPFDYGEEARITAGSRVELLGPVTLKIDPSLDAGYREAAGKLTPEGVPVFRVISLAQEDA